MASSLRTKLRIAYNVIFAPGFWDAVIGRFAWVPLTPVADLSPCPVSGAKGKGEGMRDLRGALHNHSTYSDGLGDVPTVMAAASNAGVDFVLLADHNTMEPLRDGWQERYAESSPFLLVGAEVTVGDGRFLLALDAPPEYEPVAGGTAQAGVDAIRAARAFPLISLPFDMKHPFEDWDITGYEGLEVLNFSTIARRHINFLSLLWILLARHSGGMAAVIRMMATRPDAALARWDALTRGGRRRVVGIGSLDAHARMKMFGKMYSIPTYEDSFRACQTHVFVPAEVSGAGRVPAVNAALRAGRCYFSYDCLGDPTGFGFHTTNERTDLEVTMGERLAARDGESARFAATVPGENILLRLYRDGEPVASSEGGCLSVTLPATPGAYRVEAYRYSGRFGAFYWGMRPWIWSNPVYIAPE